MPRRTKVLIITTLLLVLAIPAIYVAFTWHVADPLRFRYVGHGKVEMLVNPFDVAGPRIPMVPMFIEVQNTTNLPVLLMEGEVRAERDSASAAACVHLHGDGDTIPRYGTIRLETLENPEGVQRLEHGAFAVSYESLSGTQVKACELVLLVGEQLHEHLHIDIITGFNINTNKSVTPLIIDPAQPPEPSTSKATSVP